MGNTGILSVVAQFGKDCGAADRIGFARLADGGAV
jgi:hypothetical protein